MPVLSLFTPASQQISFFLYQKVFDPFSRHVHRLKSDAAKRSQSLAWVVAVVDRLTPTATPIATTLRREWLPASHQKVL